jgi:Flp pilus assembly protein TadG
MRFVRDEDGAVLVEFTLIMPIIFALIFFFIGAFQLLNQYQTTTFVAQASAASGARALDGTAGAIQNATQQATKAYQANSAAFVLGSTPSLGKITALDANGQPTSDDAAAKLLKVQVSATAAMWVPWLQPSITSNATATD